MSMKETLLAILAVTFGVSLMGAGAYAIGLAVQVYTKFPDEPVTPFASFVYGILGVAALFGGALLLIRAYRGPKKSGK